MTSVCLLSLIAWRCSWSSQQHGWSIQTEIEKCYLSKTFCIYLVVVPGNQLNEVRVERDASSSIEDWRVIICDEVSTDNLFFGVGQDALHFSFGCFFDDFLDGIHRSWSLGTTSQVDDRNIRCRNSERHSSELAWTHTELCWLSGFECLPFNSGITLPTALAAPVEAGMMFWAAPLNNWLFL